MQYQRAMFIQRAKQNLQFHNIQEQHRDNFQITLPHELEVTKGQFSSDGASNASPDRIGFRNVYPKEQSLLQTPVNLQELATEEDLTAELTHMDNNVDDVSLSNDHNFYLISQEQTVDNQTQNAYIPPTAAALTNFNLECQLDSSKKNKRKQVVYLPSLNNGTNDNVAAF